MATRIYRPDAGRSWREASNVSANAEISTMLARNATDMANKRLKRNLTTAEFNMKQATQRTTAWAKAYEKVQGGAEHQQAALAYQAGQIGQRGAEIQRLATRIQRLDQAHDKALKAGTLTEAAHNAYLAERLPVYDRYKQLKPILNAQRGDYKSAAASYEKDRQRLSSLASRYDRSTKQAQRAANAYKASVKRYNRDFYPV